MNDRFVRFGRALGKLAAAYGRQLTEDLVEVYAEDLADIEPGALEEAMRLARRSCKFFPTIAELREFAEKAEPECAYLALPAPPLEHCPACGGPKGHRDCGPPELPPPEAADAIAALYAKFGAAPPKVLQASEEGEGDA